MMDGADIPDKPSIRDWLKIKTAPDVLDTIANLSNDEVFTSPGLANQMLDLLPAHVWSDPTLKFLDPCCKTGVFLREIVKRLMSGLITAFPDEQVRREHILRNQVYGIAITELTALMSRRTVYCASDATRLPNPDYPENCFSAVVFDTPEGNIKFPQVEHNIGKDGKCAICGANSDTSIGEDGRESYAYPFIHMDIREIFGDMQFDVIIGNPPYQLNDGGHGGSASPIYQLFFEVGKSLSPKFLSMIIPARWYAGGKGLDTFRHDMLTDKNLSVLVDIQNASECFPGVEIKGGVCYFIRKDVNQDECEVINLKNGVVVSSNKRQLNEYDVLIRSNAAVSILNKVLSKTEKFIEDSVSRQKPFGFRTNFNNYSLEENLTSIKIFARGEVGWIDRDKVLVGAHMVDQFKVITSRAYGAGENFPHQIMGKPIICSPGSCCTETYIVAGCFSSFNEASNFSDYMKTRFFRFLVSLRKNTQDLNRDRFKFVPQVDLSQEWTDENLYAHFGITKEEIIFIESMIREMS